MGVSGTSRLTLRIDSLSGLHWVGIAAALISAAVHLRLGVGFAPAPLGIGFIIAGLGFVGAIALVLADIRRQAVYALGIPFTGGQLVLWYYLNFLTGPKAFPGGIGTLGAVDKVAQVILILVLILLLRQ